MDSHVRRGGAKQTTPTADPADVAHYIVWNTRVSPFTIAPNAKRANDARYPNNHPP
ncbi:hypothetical protein LBMAG48_27120 [Phycisphaerae bacterium]|nr:hypothetical protein LBMAG48_27120 [Phycisphaerae bacterium]